MCESKPKQWNLQVTTTKLTEEEAELKGETEYIYLWSRSKGPQPASPPYQYYTKKLELAGKQVWKKDSMTNGEAIFPKRPVKTTGFFSSVRQKKTYYYTFWQKFSLNFAASVNDIVSGLGNKSTKPE